MDPKKKILILYASAGHGHEKAARALYETIKKRHPECDAQCLDTIKLAGQFSGELYKQTYLVQIKYMPWLWGFFYYSFDVPFIYFFMRYVRRVLNTFSVPKLRELLVQEDPDIVISTHFQSIEVACYLKRKGLIHSKVVSVITDYMPHHVWTDRGVDLYCVAADGTKHALSGLGVNANSIHITGIPIQEKFSRRQSRLILCHKLGLQEDIFTALITSGGVGLNTIYEMTERLTALDPPIQLIVICGTNQALLDHLKILAQTQPLLKPFGFVDNMDEFMDVSDVLVGKAGGITISEAFAKGLPLVLFRSLPGQEGRNARFVCDSGAGLRVDSTDALAVILKDWIAHPDKITRAKQAAARIAKPDAALDIIRLVLE